MFFNETHLDNNSSTILTFIKSANVQVFPCGRRRSTTDMDGKETTATDRYSIPFDPEARLNTEANNRKHSGLNGYTQTYLKDWDRANKFLTMSLGGYLFNITLDDDYIETETIEKLDGSKEYEYAFLANKFGTDIVSALSQGEESQTKIYANIVVEYVQLYSGFKDYYTTILRDQSASDGPEMSLDLLNTEIANRGSDNKLNDLLESDNYYFSGLSFSTSPLTGEDKTWSSISRLVIRDAVAGTEVKQTIVSLCILNKTTEEGETEATWKLYQPALLPKIEHGDTEDSIVVTGNALMKSALDVEGLQTAYDQIKAIEDLEDAEGEKKPNIEAKRTKTTVAEISTANISTANITTATITTAANMVDAQQMVKIDGPVEAAIEEGYYNIPVIFVRQIGTEDNREYQLQITRTNTITQSN